MGIYGYDRTYRTARTMLALIEVIGWLVVIGGFGLAVYGTFTGGASKLFNGDPTLNVRILAALPGLGTALGGIFLVAWTQTSRASVDTAEISREMLGYMRRDRKDGKRPDDVPDKAPAIRPPKAGAKGGTSVSEPSVDKRSVDKPSGGPKAEAGKFDPSSEAKTSDEVDERLKSSPAGEDESDVEPEAAKEPEQPAKRPVVVEKRIHRGYNIVVYDNGYAGVYTENDGWKVLVSMDELNKFIDGM